MQVFYITITNKNGGKNRNAQRKKYNQHSSKRDVGRMGRSVQDVPQDKMKEKKPRDAKRSQKMQQGKRSEASGK